MLVDSEIPKIMLYLLDCNRRKLNNQIVIIIARRDVFFDFAAFLALVYDLQCLLAFTRLDSDRAQDSAAIARPVTGIVVEMERRQAVITMVSATGTQRGDYSAADTAGEPLVYNSEFSHNAFDYIRLQGICQYR